MKRIVIDAREYPTSTGRYHRKLLEYLEKIDGDSIEREYIVMIKSVDFERYQPSAQNFKKVRADFKEFTFAEQLGFLRLIRNFKADLVHFGMVQQPAFYKGRVVTTMQDLTGLRFVNPETNPLLIKIRLPIYSWLNRRVAKKSAHLITPTEFVKKDVANYTGVDSKKITVTLESADKISEPPVAIEELAGQEFLMYVGRALPHKNLMRLIDAFGIVKSSKPALKLVLVGKNDSHLKRHLDYTQRQGISDVVATGYVSEGELRWLYENTACYCFPSLSEGFGLPSLEAMAHGAPVASSNATCLPEVNGDAAHYFDPLDTNDMAEKITEVIDNPKLRQELIKKGTAQVKKYSWERMARQTLEVYKKALEQSPKKIKHPCRCPNPHKI